MLADGSDLYRHPLLYDVEHLGFQGDVGFYAGICADTPPGRVLELGCGTGRLALALAERGFAVDGLDAAPAMLARAEQNRSRLSSAAAELRFIEGDCLSHRGSQAGYAKVLAAFNTLQHIGPGGLDALLQTVAYHLVPGGAFACDLFAPLASEGTPAELDFGDREERAGPRGERWTVERRSAFEPDGRRQRTEYRFWRHDADGTLREQGRCQLLRYQWRRDELADALERQGFEGIQVWGDLAGTPWAPGASRLVLQARLVEPVRSDPARAR